jgi:hypothetical protein
MIAGGNHTAIHRRSTTIIFAKGENANESDQVHQKSAIFERRLPILFIYSSIIFWADNWEVKSYSEW